MAFDGFRMSLWYGQICDTGTPHGILDNEAEYQALAKIREEVVDKKFREEGFLDGGRCCVTALVDRIHGALKSCLLGSSEYCVDVGLRKRYF